MREFILYSDDGRILSAGAYSSIFSEERIAGFHPDDNILFVSSADGITSDDIYVVGTKVVAKSFMTATWDKTTITANNVEKATLSGLPTVCTVYIDGDPVSIIDGSLEFKAASAGMYTIRVDEVSYVAQEWQINAD